MTRNVAVISWLSLFMSGEALHSAFGSAPLRGSGAGKNAEATPPPSKPPVETGESPSVGMASVSGESESRVSDSRSGRQRTAPETSGASASPLPVGGAESA